ncbi:GNAT family N-acetyltransferase [Luteococcus peritonei]|uniref:GNAT family N-acetyltransferase n=1 Tax=Luteococcus peritonei TaxID=88874 RepID=A0ABW4RSQ7_9ACTN
MICAAARDLDVPAILELEQGSFPAAEQWSEQAWREELQAGDRFVITARDAEDRVKAAATFQCVADTADLHRIMVAREHRGEGLAKQLMQAGMQWAQAIGASRMLLEVREDNEAALGLYDGCGFEQLARRENYYGPGAHALVMAAPLADEKDEADHE